MDFELAFSVIFTGLVVVFVALVLLIFLMWAVSKLIQMAQGGSKPSAPAAPKAPPVVVSPPKPSTPAMVVEDGISDEVIAVITAAISAMSEGEAGFSIKSIKKSVSKEARPAWAVAGLIQNTRPF